MKDLWTNEHRPGLIQKKTLMLSRLWKWWQPLCCLMLHFFTNVQQNLKHSISNSKAGLKLTLRLSKKYTWSFLSVLKDLSESFWCHWRQKWEVQFWEEVILVGLEPNLSLVATISLGVSCPIASPGFLEEWKHGLTDHQFDRMTGVAGVASPCLEVDAVSPTSSV